MVCREGPEQGPALGRVILQSHNPMTQSHESLDPSLRFPLTTTCQISLLGAWLVLALPHPRGRCEEKEAESQKGATFYFFVSPLPKGWGLLLLFY